MHSYKEQLDIVKGIRIKEGQTRRMNCPFCGGINTFGISKHRGIVAWHCFRASCPVKGKVNFDETAESIRVRLNSKAASEDGVYGFPIPDFLSGIDTHDYILRYLHDNNSLEAYDRGLVDIRYSPSEDRMMISVSNGKGYIGRAFHLKPKWKKYGDCSHLFTCGTGPIAVLVEDALSACAVGAIPDYTGVSILGTTLTTQHKIDLRKYDLVLVCLDPDAASKSVSMSKQIPHSTVRYIENDLKYFGKKDILRMLNAT